MSSPEQFERGLTRRLTRIADESLDGFDAQRVADRAMAPRRQEWWRVIAVAGASVLSVAAIAAAGDWLSIGDIRPAVGDPQQQISAIPAPSASAEPSLAVGLSQEAAVAAARVAAPQSAERPVVSAASGPFSELLQPPEAYEFSSDVPHDQWVWVIVLASGEGLEGQGTIVVIDYLDGRVYGVMDFQG